MSRRDDLEAIGYVLMYFLRGSLPWQGIATRRKEEKYKRIYEKKNSTTVEELCKGYPEAFKIYISYCKSLNFEDQPDYGYIRRLFKDLFIGIGNEYDFLYDWCLSPELRPSLESNEEVKDETPPQPNSSKNKKKKCTIF